ncbi:hypothetical protein [Nostoc sp. TCL26-01]|uniref:hypothetical protein n=1 Tax=Nostoc sp. TCL26-01 TaxID=2576904 RepID=UPI0015B85546|nr:hypothetical protein [Nostoc sp. TCL26-01]QLE59975.1 hypothetical protein FD725_31670 [Nostoc sp. TCL26-01]
MVQQMTQTKELSKLINQSLTLIEKIKNHPQFKLVEYSPDLTLGDAQQALIELQSELRNPQGEPINIFALEGFTEKIGDLRL